MFGMPGVDYTFITLHHVCGVARAVLLLFLLQAIHVATPRRKHHRLGLGMLPLAVMSNLQADIRPSTQSQLQPLLDLWLLILESQCPITSTIPSISVCTIGNSLSFKASYTNCSHTLNCEVHTCEKATRAQCFFSLSKLMCLVVHSCSMMLVTALCNLIFAGGIMEIRTIPSSYTHTLTHIKCGNSL